MKTDKSAGAEAVTFEAAMKRLETIVGAMEGGELSLENLIAQFEEGQKLIALCNARLNEVERKVELLVKRGENLAVEPFEGEAGKGAVADGAEGGELPPDDRLFRLDR